MIKRVLVREKDGEWDILEATGGTNPEGLSILNWEFGAYSLQQGTAFQVERELAMLAAQLRGANPQRGYLIVLVSAKKGFEIPHWDLEVVTQTLDLIAVITGSLSCSVVWQTSKPN